MTTIASRLASVSSSIIGAESKYHRVPGKVQLVAVSKSRTPAEILTAFGAGQHHFGENYVQEAANKITMLRAYPLIWHFIGRLQNNKTRTIAELFSWVHSLTRLETAQRLSQQRPKHLPPLNCCIQVNCSADSKKNGVIPDTVFALASAVRLLPNVRLRGLMTMGLSGTDVDKQRRCFAFLKSILTALNQQGLRLDTLSMGMSHDFETAIAEGATIIRLGTAIFGARDG